MNYLKVTAILLILAAILSAATIFVAHRGEGNVAEGAEVGRELIALEKRDAPLLCIDPGHGGELPGCIVGDTYEKELTLRISLKLREKLLNAGFNVMMTRQEDKHISLEDRVRAANDAEAELFVSIHCNSFREDTSISGFESYYYKNSVFGKALSNSVLESASKVGIITRYSREQDYYVIRCTDMPAILIETGYMTNPSELEKLCSEEYQELLTDAIAEGILNYLE